MVPELEKAFHRDFNLGRRTRVETRVTPAFYAWHQARSLPGLPVKVRAEEGEAPQLGWVGVVDLAA
ncbi:MAG: hypothetical protein GC129_05980 [Proteobacteria bacterium]|nr:hypothetical protein [Pseudomonadota bacterium]